MEETLSSQVIYRGRILNLRVDTVRLPSGRQTTREVVEHQDVIAVLPVDSDGALLLVRQYRGAVGRELLEIPAGGIEPGEDPEAAVRREMQEETGYLPGRVERLGGFYTSPGFCTEYLHLFLATDLAPSRLYDEDTESIKLERLTIDQALDLVKSGTICDAKSVAGLLIFADYLKAHPDGRSAQPSA